MLSVERIAVVSSLTLETKELNTFDKLKTSPPLPLNVMFMYFFQHFKVFHGAVY